MINLLYWPRLSAAAAACTAAAAAACSYRTSVEEVPVGEYTIPLGQAQLLREGSDITLIGWGAQVSCTEHTLWQQCTLWMQFIQLWQQRRAKHRSCACELTLPWLLYGDTRVHVLAHCCSGSG
jgi:hypothetical protein